MDRNIIVLLMAFFIASAFTGIIIAPCEAHEGSGFTHMTGDSGPIIWQKSCMSDVILWGMDMDEDYKIDKCVMVLHAHKKFHIAPAKMVIEDGKTTCVCEVIKESL